MGRGFEDLDRIADRDERVLDVLSTYPAVVCVTHEWLGRHLIQAALGLPGGNDAIERGWFALTNASITEVEVEEGSAELVRLGDTHHLGGLARPGVAGADV